MTGERHVKPLLAIVICDPANTASLQHYGWLEELTIDGTVSQALALNLSYTHFNPPPPPSLPSIAPLSPIVVLSGTHLTKMLSRLLADEDLEPLQAESSRESRIIALIVPIYDRGWDNCWDETDGGSHNIRNVYKATGSKMFDFALWG